jgi:hypothetical protein
VTASYVSDCRVATGPVAEAGCPPDLPDPSLVGTSVVGRDSNTPYGFLAPSFATLTRLPNVATIASRPRLPMPQRRYWDTQAWNSRQAVPPGQMCVDRRKRRVLYPGLCLPFSFLVLRVLSSTLLPGFTGPDSSVLPVDLPPPAPYPLRVRLIGSVLWHLRQLSIPVQKGFPG